MAEADRSALITTDTHGTRTHTCGALRADHEGESVVLKGWVNTRRDLGGLVFIDLRDRYGLTQIVFSPQANEDAYETAQQLRSEDVVSVRGTVTARNEQAVNLTMQTGSIEVQGDACAVLNILMIGLALKDVAFPITCVVFGSGQKPTERWTVPYVGGAYQFRVVQE